MTIVNILILLNFTFYRFVINSLQPYQQHFQLGFVLPLKTRTPDLYRHPDNVTTFRNLPFCDFWHCCPKLYIVWKKDIPAKVMVMVVCGWNLYGWYKGEGLSKDPFWKPFWKNHFVTLVLLSKNVFCQKDVLLPKEMCVNETCMVGTKVRVCWKIPSSTSCKLSLSKNLT